MKCTKTKNLFSVLNFCYFCFKTKVKEKNTNLINKYLYNGKEQQEQTNYYDYGFRQMDAQLGRWHVTDAMAESYMSTSPYAYVMNNPISHIDVMGLYMGGGYPYTGPKPYLDSNSSRHGGGMFYQNNMPGTLNGLDRTYNRSRAEGSYSTGTLSGHWEDEYEYTETTKLWVYFDGEGRYIRTEKESVEFSKRQTGRRRWVLDEYGIDGPAAQGFFRTLNGGNGTPKWRKALAYVLRNSRFLIIPNYPVPFFPLIIANPFYGAEAVSGDIGVLGFAGEADLGAAFILSGKDAGEIVPYTEITGPSIAFELDGGIEICRIDIRGGSSDDFEKRFIFGKRDKAWVSVGLQPESFGFGVGGSVAKSNPKGTPYTIIATGISVSWGVSPSPIIGGWNQGQINPW